jgi:molybdopterin molybdotransferase
VELAANIRPAGEDVRAGSVLVPAGRRLSSAELGILATAGHGAALTYPKVRVSVVSVGELVEPGRPAGFGQVRDANSYALVGAVRDVGAVPYRVGIVQDLEADLRETLLSNLTRADVFICAGGVGEEGDRIGLLVAGMGEVETYRVAMRPGGMTRFVPALVSHRQGAWRALPTGPGAPNLLGAVVQANGFIVLPPEEESRAAGDRVRAQIFRPLER